ncbi:hypothetical protein AK812_SmicGene39244 [Symbiodinium microadriaticum]|uniref:Uncharacterized protein n=1 Tax=Symbiodinium microadriaticum TaxID=2951 RepID=A0A1Q9CC03_SYMMI|nr:hypothetical protein AK812_SmicGene39244 [Symbiodinium microadriaticum]
MVTKEEALVLMVGSGTFNLTSNHEEVGRAARGAGAFAEELLALVDNEFWVMRDFVSAVEANPCVRGGAQGFPIGRRAIDNEVEAAAIVSVDLLRFSACKPPLLLHDPTFRANDLASDLRARAAEGELTFIRWECCAVHKCEIMSQFFWALKRGTSDILRTFTGEFDRMAWMHVGKLRLDEGETTNKAVEKRDTREGREYLAITGVRQHCGGAPLALAYAGEKGLNLWSMPDHETAVGHPAVSVIPESTAPSVDRDSLADDKRCRDQGACAS